MKMGKWSFDGEYFTFGSSYHIGKDQPAPNARHGGTWLEHLRMKNWFTSEVEADFVRIWDHVHLAK